MKIKILFLFILFFISINVFAQQSLIEISLLKENYLPAETLQTEIFLNQDPERELAVTNIFLRDNSNQNIKIAPIFTEIEKNHYFVYFDLPQDLEEGSYSFTVEKVLFKKDNILTEVIETKIFNLTKEDLPILAIKPAVIVVDVENPKFEIKVENKGDIPIGFTIETTEKILHLYKTPITLQASRSRTFKFTINTSEIKENLKENLVINYSRSYTIPIYIFKEKIEEVEEKEIETIKFITELSYLEKTIEKDLTLKGALKFQNLLNETLHDLNFKLTGNLADIVRLNLTYLEKIEAGETLEQYIWINEEKNPQQEKYFGEFVLTTTEGYSATFPIYIDVEIEKPVEEVPEIEEVEEIPEEKEEEISFEFFPTEPEEEIEIEEEKRSKVGIVVGVLAILIILIVILFSKRKKPTPKTFKEYVSEVEKQR